MSGNDHHAGPDGVANDPRQPCPDCGADPDFNDIHWQRCPSLTDTRPSLSEGRRLYEAASTPAPTDYDDAANDKALDMWFGLNGEELLELAEADMAYTNAINKGVIGKRFEKIADRLESARKAFRP